LDRKAGIRGTVRFDRSAASGLKRLLLSPLWMISISLDAIGDDGQHAKAVASSIDILPSMVVALADYWNRPRNSLRAKKVLARRRPSRQGAILDARDVAERTTGL
jgi:hypothetical protein